jgi:hypothetical protein
VAEAHAPGLIGGRAGDAAVALYDDSETPQVRGPGINQFVPFDQEGAEAKCFGT